MYIVLLTKYMHRYLSEASVVTLGIFEQGSGPVYLDEVQCSGEETQLAECSHAGLIENQICGRRTLQSEHFFDVAIKCNGKTDFLCLFVHCKVPMSR